MRTALQASASYQGYNEGNLLPLLGKLHEGVEQYYDRFPQRYLGFKGNMVSALDPGMIKALLTNTLGSLVVDMMGEGRWFDKSPMGREMIRTCPILLEIFPSGRVIFCKRRGIENILSRRRKFPNFDFASACQIWADTMQAWQGVRATLDGHYLEVDQRDMALHPRRVAKAVQLLLGLSEAETHAMAESLRNHRVEQTRAAQESRAVGLDETDWSDEEKRLFKATCLPMMEAFGYRLESGAESRRIPFKLFVPHPDSARSIEHRHVLPGIGFKPGGGDTLQLRPNPHGEAPAEIRYLSLSLYGHSCFSARLSVGDAQGQRVKFGFRIADAARHKDILSSSKVVAVNEPVDWQVDFPPLRGTYDVVISAAMAAEPSSATPPWAYWTHAQVS